MSDQAQGLVLWRTEHSLLSVEELARAAGVQTGTIEVFVRRGAHSFVSKSSSLTDLVDEVEKLLK